jgi:hypothetical protein
MPSSWVTPWEIIIKLYRAKKRHLNRPRIKDWGTDFVRYLSKFGTIKEAHKRDNIYQAVLSELDDLVRQASRKIEDVGVALNSTEGIKRLIGYVDRQSAALNKRPSLFSSAQRRRFIKSFGDTVVSAAVEQRREFNDQKLLRSAAQHCLLLLFKDVFSPRSSGIVIAGYGSSEYFPTLVHYRTDGYIGDKLKLVKDGERDLSRDLPATIIAFAQREMVDRFMSDADPLYRTAVQQFFWA